MTEASVSTTIQHPAIGKAGTDPLQTYLANRAQFYAIALAGPLSESVLARLHDAESPPEPPTIPIPSKIWDGIAGLLLRDVYKKPEFGAALGRTTISLRLLLENAQFFEEAGILIYGALGRAMPDQRAMFEAASGAHFQRLMTLIRLEDDLRYHHLRLVTA